MRSAVAYMDNGVRVVGDPAFHDDKEMAKGNVFYYAKRVLARRYFDPDIQEFLKKHPFGAGMQPSSSNKDTATCMFHTNSKGHKDSEYLYPEQISAGCLSTLKEAYENHLNQTVSLTCPPVIVITVPANFTTAQRKATLNAARIAGIENVTLCNEPTAGTRILPLTPTHTHTHTHSQLHLGITSQ
jgi:molecular chaperone DnaK